MIGIFVFIEELSDDKRKGYLWSYKYVGFWFVYDPQVDTQHSLLSNRWLKNVA